MITPRFNLKDKKANSTLILLVIEQNKDRVRLTTGLSVPPNHWNDKTQFVRENREFDDADRINSKLKLIKKSVNDAVDYFSSIGVEASVYQVKEKYHELLSNPKKQSSASQFWVYFDEFIGSQKGRIADRTLIDYNKALRKHLRATEDFTHKDFPICSVSFNSLKSNGGFVKKLDFYLTNEAKNSKGEKGFSLNSVGKQMKNLKAFLHWCFKQEYATYFDTSHIITYQEEIDNVYLNEAELKRIYDLKIEDNEKARVRVRVRDLFLIGCETGLRFSDLRRIQSQHINGNYINLIQTKTTDKVSIPINSISKEILKKYNYSLPNFDESELKDFNSLIKKICADAEINENILMKRKIKNVVKEIFIKKHDLVSSHTCRRSFCTNRFLKRIPTKVIMAISGHKTEKSFMKYLKLNNNEIIKTYEEQLLA